MTAAADPGAEAGPCEALPEAPRRRARAAKVEPVLGPVRPALSVPAIQALALERADLHASFHAACWALVHEMRRRGTRRGDPEPTDPAFVCMLEARDRARQAWLEACDRLTSATTPEAFGAWQTWIAGSAPAKSCNRTADRDSKIMPSLFGPNP